MHPYAKHLCLILTATAFTMQACKKKDAETSKVKNSIKKLSKAELEQMMIEDGVITREEVEQRKKALIARMAEYQKAIKAWETETGMTRKALSCTSEYKPIGAIAVCKMAQKPIFLFEGFTDVDGELPPFTMKLTFAKRTENLNDSCGHKFGVRIPQQNKFIEFSDLKANANGLKEIEFKDYKGPLTIQTWKSEFAIGTPVPAELKIDTYQNFEACSLSVHSYSVVPAPVMVKKWRADATHYQEILEKDYKHWLAIRELSDIAGKSLREILSKQESHMDSIGNRVFSVYTEYRKISESIAAEGSEDIIFSIPGLDIEPPTTSNTSTPKIDLPSLTSAEILQVLTETKSLKIVDKANGKTTDYPYRRFKNERDWPAWFTATISEYSLKTSSTLVLDDILRHNSTSFVLEQYSSKLAVDSSVSFEDFSNGQSKTFNKSALENALTELRADVVKIRSFLSKSQFYKDSVRKEYDDLMIKIRALEVPTIN